MEEQAGAYLRKRPCRRARQTTCCPLLNPHPETLPSQQPTQLSNCGHGIIFPKLIPPSNNLRADAG